LNFPGCSTRLLNRAIFRSVSKSLQAASEKIKELLQIGAKMHTWIFLHTTDEQAAYDEIGLTDEQNAMFGYSGQMILKVNTPKEKNDEH
jgi:hypothetical protein